MILYAWGTIALIAFISGLSIYLLDLRDRKPNPKIDGGGYQSIYPVSRIALVCCVYICINVLFSYKSISVHLLLLSIYYCGMLLLRPLLLKIANSRTCSYVWCVPLFAIILSSYSFLLELSPYRIYIVLPFHITDTMLWIWLAGSVVCILWHVFNHLDFRRQLLRSSKRVMEGELLEIWYKQQYICNVSKKYFPLYISRDLVSPVSVGVFHKTTFVALPDKEYSEDALKLIFRHELIHNGRRHGGIKVMLAVLISLLWFNPLVWLALRKVAEDMELNCDETVLLGYDGKVRKAYATLLLQTAADHRGFNSCLNGSAGSLKHRIQKILKPAGRGKTVSSGISFAVVALLTSLLVVFVSFVGPKNTLGNYLHEELGSELQMMSAWVQWDSIIDEVPMSKDPEILKELMDEPVSVLYQPYINAVKPPYAVCSVMTQSGKKYITVMEDFVKIDSEVGANGGIWYMLPEDFNFMEFASDIGPLD